MKRRTVLSMAGVLLILLIPMQSVHAQLIFNLTPAGQNGVPGTLLTFSATLENVGNDPVFLNGAGASLTGNDLTLDSSPFFNNAPLFLNAGDMWSGDIFTVNIDPATVPADYVGAFAIQGGFDGNAQDNLATQFFLVTILPTLTTPEPGVLTLVMGMTVFGGGLLLARRRKRD